MPDGVTPILLAVIGLAIAFDYINGFHDTANAIATSVSTRALRPGWAIAMSSTANFAGALVGTKVAVTISGGIIDPNVESQTVIAAALVGAIIWNLITWRLGIPSSSSHALIGGLLGASLVSAGISSWQIDGVITKVLIPLVLSPVIGFLFGLLVHGPPVQPVPKGASGKPERAVPPPAGAGRPGSWPSATAATTRRRRWAS